MIGLILSVLMALPAMAVELEYGGYWRTRGYTMDGFSGNEDVELNDVSKIDARGRLWNRFLINDDLKWTNRIEFNVVWGDELKGGGIGTDGTDYIRFKHSYVDLDTTVSDMDLHIRLGLQGYEAAKGMLFSDDFAGMILSTEGDMAEYRLVWMKAFEGSTLSGEYEEDLEDLDVDFVGFNPTFSLMDDALKVDLYGFYLFSEDAREWSGTTGNEEISVFYLGAEMNYTTDMGNFWGILLYETGSAEVANTDFEFDVTGYIAALGAEFDFDGFGVHGQVFYASGDGDLADDEAEGFFVPRGQSYYWAEIMGLGVFDAAYSNGSPGDTLHNIMAANIGISYEISDTATLTADVWHAEHAETNQLVEEDALGTEIDLRLDYMLNDDLKLTAVAAYLLADDATTMGAENDADPWEVGVMLSFKFNSAN